MGKRNIEIVERDGISASFHKKDENLRIALKNESLERIRNILVDEPEEIRRLISELIDARDQDMFEIC